MFEYFQIKLENPVIVGSFLNEDIYVISGIKASKNQLSQQSSEIITGSEAKSDFDYFGENNKYILILVNYKNYQYMPDNEKILLEKILKSLKLDYSDVAVLNLYHYPNISFDKLKKYFGCNKLFLFGVLPESINISTLMVYHTLEYNDTKILYSDDLSEVAKNQESKLKLWNALKKCL